MPDGTDLARDRIGLYESCLNGRKFHFEVFDESTSRRIGDVVRYFSDGSDKGDPFGTVQFE